MSGLRAFRLVTVVVVGLATFTHGTTGRTEPARDVCRSPRVIIEQDLDPEWHASISQLVTDLSVEADWDRCAVVTVMPAGREVIAHVKLQDGRAAVRRVGRPSELASTVEAVLFVSAEPRLEPLASSKSEWLDDARDEKIGAPVPTFGPDASAHIELGLGADARALGSPFLVGAGALFAAQVALGHWLIATDGHWDVFDTPVGIAAPAGFNMQTFAIGVGVGRRFRGESVHADVLLGPEAVVENEEADGTGDGVGGSSSDFRVHLTTRVLTARSRPLHWFGAFDVDASPARIRRATQLASTLPTPPSWSAGLAVGVLWESR